MVTVFGAGVNQQDLWTQMVGFFFGGGSSPCLFKRVVSYLCPVEKLINKNPSCVIEYIFTFL